MTAEVTRVGDTVRRSGSAASEFTASLLSLLEKKEFTGAPRYLRREEDVDVFSYLLGEVPEHFRTWSDNQVSAVGALLRAMHDATRGSELAGRFPVVCHHDAGPNSTVFQNEIPFAFIDFDTAAPGSPLEDIGYTAWTWCISSRQRVSVERQAIQVRLLVDAYGVSGGERAVVMDCVMERQMRNARFWAELLAGSWIKQTAPEVISNRIAWSRRKHDFTFANREIFERALA